MWFSYITCFLVLPFLVMCQYRVTNVTIPSSDNSPKNVAIAATAISLSSKDPNQINAVRIVRGVASVGLLILAFLPVPIVLWALSKVPTGGFGDSTELQTRYATGYGPTGHAQEESGVAKVAALYPGEPASGYGPPPATTSDARATAMFILIPALLLTIGLGVRTAQGLHVPVDNGDGTVTMAWVSLPFQSRASTADSMPGSI